MTEPDLLSALSNVDIFEGLSSRVLTRIAEGGHRSAFASGSNVIVQGDSVAGFKAFSPSGVEMHVILDGAATVAINGVTHATLVPGEYFGELSLIDGRPRSADVVAAEGGLTTFALSKWAFEDLLEKHPEVAVPMLRVLCARLRSQETPARDTD